MVKTNKRVTCNTDVLSPDTGGGDGGQERDDHEAAGEKSGFV